jgi:elongation factor Ts
MTQKVNNIISKVKKLRLTTSAGVMDCKKALEKSDGDLKEAEKLLKKMGLEKAGKKKERETKQGWVATYTHATRKVGVGVALLCETDFVSRNAEFQQLAREICLQIAAMAPKDKKELLAQEYIRDPSKTVAELIDEAIAKFGENIRVGEFFRIEI